MNKNLNLSKKEIHVLKRYKEKKHTQFHSNILHFGCEKAEKLGITDDIVFETQLLTLDCRTSK